MTSFHGARIDRNGFPPTYNPPSSHSQCEPLLGAPDDPAVQQADREQHDRQEDRRTRDVVRQVVVFRRLGKQNARGEDIDPVDSVVRMRKMRVVHGTTCFPDRHEEAADEQNAGDDLEEAKGEREAARTLTHCFEPGRQEDQRRHGVLDLLDDDHSVAPFRSERNDHAGGILSVKERFPQETTTTNHS